MQAPPFDSLFWNNDITTTVTVVEGPPLAEVDYFKIPVEIIQLAIDNCYYGDGTIHPGDHLLLLHELCSLFKCAGISEDQVKMLKNGRSLGWEEIVPLFYSKFYPPSEIHKDRNKIYNFWPQDEESIAQAWG